MRCLVLMHCPVTNGSQTMSRTLREGRVVVHCVIAWWCRALAAKHPGSASHNGETSPCYAVQAGSRCLPKQCTSILCGFIVASCFVQLGACSAACYIQTHQQPPCNQSTMQRCWHCCCCCCPADLASLVQWSCPPRPSYLPTWDTSLLRAGGRGSWQRRSSSG